ncbi:MAG TPA: alpha/beta fold hydrolase [Actinomycetota bacterium]|nr:alpha/beta fold hydrolase [Actinomycetota bacterium]
MVDFLVWLLYFLVFDTTIGRHEAMESTRPSWVPDHLYPFESRYLDVDGGRVHYVDEGEGPVLLFLHGNPTWSFLYRNVVLGLRDSFRCIALDYPGFGLSTAPEGYAFTPDAHAAVVERFVADLDLEDVTLMAQDWGGPIGLTVATRQPERFAGFVLGNTWAWPLNGIFHFEAFARVMGSRLTRPWIRNMNVFVNVMIPLGTAVRLPGAVMQAYRGPFAGRDDRIPTWTFPRQLLGSRPFMEELARSLPRVTDLPVLFVWGGRDFALRAGVELPRFQALFPNHETVVLDGAKHFFQEDAPDEVVSAIRAWAKERTTA